jgi:hypothetical protein
VIERKRERERKLIEREREREGERERGAKELLRKKAHALVCVYVCV